MKFETKTIKVESGFAAAYADRYRRLGYDIYDTVKSEENGKKFTVIAMRRDTESSVYPLLLQLEHEVEWLCIMAREHAGEPDKSFKRHRLAAWILFGAGCLIMALGISLTVSGLLINMLSLALGGWACVIAGAALIIVWSFLRDKWRLRKAYARADAENPGFGIDEYSKKVEGCLKKAEQALADLS